MHTITELQQEIIRLKKEKDFCILAHAYQTHDILEVADFVGDSYGLSKNATEVPQKNVLMCGVRFMAETAKILSPEKTVILSHSDAGCPMAEQLSVEELRRLKKEYPDAAVVAYINTTAALKAECDVCVTSASALQILTNMPQKEILFIPDCNLGGWLAEKLPDKKFRFIKGGCPVHMSITGTDVAAAKKAHPSAKLLVHPECLSEVTRQADYAGSTTGIMNYVKNSSDTEFIIGTDNSIVQHLEFEHPEKKFYALSKKCVCADMRLTTLSGVYKCLLGEGGEEIFVPEDLCLAAKSSIDAMFKYGG